MPSGIVTNACGLSAWEKNFIAPSLVVVSPHWHHYQMVSLLSIAYFSGLNAELAALAQ